MLACCWRGRICITLTLCGQSTHSHPRCARLRSSLGLMFVLFRSSKSVLHQQASSSPGCSTSRENARHVSYVQRKMSVCARIVRPGRELPLAPVVRVHGSQRKLLPFQRALYDSEYRNPHRRSHPSSRIPAEFRRVRRSKPRQEHTKRK